MNKVDFPASKEVRTVVEPNDWELVERSQKGDINAFEELTARHYRKVFMVVQGIVNQRDDAMEVAQETFFRAFRNIKRFKGGSAFYTWLYRIAVNLSIDFQRRQKRSFVDLRENMDEIITDRGEPKNDPFCDIRDKELGEKLQSAINELTPDHRAVIVMRVVEGLPYKDIGRILGCSEGTVMSRLHYARKKLQEKLRSFL